MANPNEVHLASLMCLTRSNFSLLVKKIEDLGYEVIVTSSFRTNDQQKKLIKSSIRNSHRPEPEEGNENVEEEDF